jgi:D-lactate dehydrogenase
MKVAVFSTKEYDRQFLQAANQHGAHELVFFEPSLNPSTAPLASGFPGVCLFVNDQADAATLEILAAHGTRLIALRCAGFNQVDLPKAEALGLTVVRVPAYSPYAVAEHVVALIQTLNRKTHRAYNRTREGNFSLDGLMGFDLHRHTVGIVGTGKIGLIFAQIMQGFGCKLLAYDLYPNPRFAELGGQYVALEEIWAGADIISLHCPLTPESHHLINDAAIAQMKPGVFLINTSRGALVDTQAVIQGLKLGKIGALGLDVYEQEADLFFEDLSSQIIQDDVFQRLLTFPNVIVTGHQAFLTREALQNIAETTLSNFSDFEQGRDCPNKVAAQQKVVSKVPALGGRN